MHRNVVYELDRMTQVDPGPDITLDAAPLNSFPDVYRHLGYLQTQAGMHVSRDLPGARGPAIEALKGRMAAWQAGRRAGRRPGCGLIPERYRLAGDGMFRRGCLCFSAGAESIRITHVPVQQLVCRRLVA